MALGEAVPAGMGVLIGVAVTAEGPMRAVTKGVSGQTASPHFHRLYPAVNIRSNAAQNSLCEDQMEHPIFIKV
jgi:hypothetical protein